MTYEACVFSVEEAVRAQRAGVHRIELNSSKPEGGCTPSYGNIAWIMKNLDIRVTPMIRPRGGGFVYTDREFDVLKEDVRMAVSLGVDSVITGVLTADSALDTKKLEEVIKIADKTPVAFHLAYERIAPEKKDEALEQLISIGVKRLLYGGRPKTYEQALECLKIMMEKANGRIDIMTCDMDVVPHSKLPEFIRNTGVQEYHMWDICCKYDLGTYSKTLDHVDWKDMADQEMMAARIALLEKAQNSY